MARTSTIQIVIDGVTRPAAKLTLGALRALSDAEAAATTNDQRLAVQVDAVRRSLSRADPAFALTVDEVMDLLDGEDLEQAYSAVMGHTVGRRAGAAGETTSP